MTSPYLKKTRSAQELDALIEKHLKGVQTIEKKVVEIDTNDMIGGIDQFCDESVAKIEEKAEQIIAAMPAWAEASIVQFFKNTEAARHTISAVVEDQSDTRPREVIISMISETSSHSLNRISQHADTAVDKIRSETEQAVKDLRLKAAIALKDFKGMAKKVTARIKESLEKARTAFETVQQSSVDQNAITEAKKETETAVIKAEKASDELEHAKVRTVARIREATDDANRRIDHAYAEAINSVQSAKVKAVSSLNEITEVALQHFSAA